MVPKVQQSILKVETSQPTAPHISPGFCPSHTVGVWRHLVEYVLIHQGVELLIELLRVLILEGLLQATYNVITTNDITESISPLMISLDTYHQSVYHH